MLLGAAGVKCLVLAHLRLFDGLCNRTRRRQADPCDSAYPFELLIACLWAEVVVALLCYACGHPHLSQLDLDLFVWALDILQLWIVESLLGRHLVCACVVLLWVSRNARVDSVYTCSRRMVQLVSFDWSEIEVVVRLIEQLSCLRCANRNASARLHFNQQGLAVTRRLCQAVPSLPKSTSLPQQCLVQLLTFPPTHWSFQSKQTESIGLRCIGLDLASLFYFTMLLIHDYLLLELLQILKHRRRHHRLWRSRWCLPHWEEWSVIEGGIHERLMLVGRFYVWYCEIRSCVWFIIRALMSKREPIISMFRPLTLVRHRRCSLFAVTLLVVSTKNDRWLLLRLDRVLVIGQMAKLSVLSLHRLCFCRLVKLHFLWDLIVVKLGPCLALTIFLSRVLLRKLMICSNQNVVRRV